MSDEGDVQLYQLLIQLDFEKVTPDLVERIEDVVCRCGPVPEERDPDCALVAMSGGVMHFTPVVLDGIDPLAVETTRDMLHNVADWRGLDREFVDAVADTLMSALRPWLKPSAARGHGTDE